MKKCIKCNQDLTVVEKSSFEKEFKEDKYGNLIEGETNGYTEIFFRCVECGTEYELRGNNNFHVNLVMVGKLYNRSYNDFSWSEGYPTDIEEDLELV